MHQHTNLGIIFLNEAQNNVRFRIFPQSGLKKFDE